jgi:hypothetical protein
VALISDKDEDCHEKSSSSKPPVDIVSAAIMAKVLEERERERLNIKHCDSCTCPRQGLVDCATQATPIMDQGILCVRCAANVRLVNNNTFIVALISNNTVHQVVYFNVTATSRQDLHD